MAGSFERAFNPAFQQSMQNAAQMREREMIEQLRKAEEERRYVQSVEAAGLKPVMQDGRIDRVATGLAMSKQQQMQDALRAEQMTKARNRAEMEFMGSQLGVARQQGQPVQASFANGVPGSVVADESDGDYARRVYQARSAAESKPARKSFSQVVSGDEIVTIDELGAEVARAPRTPLPTGFQRGNDGNLAPVPGSKPAMDAEKAAAAAKVRNQSVNKRADVVIGLIDRVLPKVGGATTGLLGSTLSMIPGSVAADVEADLGAIKANIGFQELQEMRAASPTGGALGQVAIQELDFLQASLGNLSMRQSKEQLRDNLGRVRHHFDRWRKAANGIDPDAEEQGGQVVGEAEPLKILSITPIN